LPSALHRAGAEINSFHSRRSARAGDCSAFPVIHTTLLFLFYFFAAISIYLGLLSLRGGVRFARYLRTESSRQYPEFTPFTTVFVPLRGIDEGLKENIAAIFALDYPNYEIVFISGEQDDPAWGVVEDARRSFAGDAGPAMQTIVVG